MFTLRMLISVAYGVSLYRVTDGPRWTDVDLYNIAAKAPASSPAAAFKPSSPNTPPLPEVREMLRNLLADRFALKLHQEARRLPVLTLMVSKGGPKLQPSRDPSGEPQLTMRRGELKGQNQDLKRLIAVLEGHYDQTVLDRTGLTGRYDFDLKFAPRQLGDASSNAPPTPRFRSTLTPP